MQVNHQGPLIVGLQIVLVITAGILIAALGLRSPEYFEFFSEHAVWFGLASFTIFTFGTVITYFHRSWRLVRFWLTLAALLAIHTVAYVVLLERITPWPLIWFAFVAVVEIAVLGQVLHWLGFQFAPRSTTRG
jgi:hypothetical protein